MPVALMACGGSVESDPASSGGSAGVGGKAATCQRALPVSTSGPGVAACHTKADCVQGTFDLCTAEESTPSCGDGPVQCYEDAGCNQNGQPKSFCQANKCVPACQEDGACGAARRCDVSTGRCEERPCDEASPCPSGAFCTVAKVCQLKFCDPAQASACGLAQVCDPAIFRCVAQPCSADPDCPELFGCEGGECAIKKCTCDTQCGASGYCLRGTCSDTPGQCGHNFICGRPLLVEGDLKIASLSRSEAWG